MASILRYYGFFFKVETVLIGNHNVSARAIGEFALRKLKAKNRLNPIFKPMERGFMPYLRGLKMQCAGRFTRRQRAGFTSYGFGKITLHTFSQPIDYHLIKIPLKFGVGATKIYVAHKRPRLFTSKKEGISLITRFFNNTNVAAFSQKNLL